MRAAVLYLPVGEGGQGLVDIAAEDSWTAGVRQAALSSLPGKGDIVVVSIVFLL